MPLQSVDESDVIVSTFQTCIARGEASWTNAPNLLRRILEENLWQRRFVQDLGMEVIFDHFSQFVEAPVPNGLEASIDLLKRLCRDDKEVLHLIDKAMRRKGGRPKTLDIVQGFPSGNSEQAAIRRLDKDRPDLLKKVKEGELTAHGAMVKAGFRDETVVIPMDPAKAARRLKLHFQGDRLTRLIEELGK